MYDDPNKKTNDQEEASSDASQTTETTEQTKTPNEASQADELTTEQIKEDTQMAPIENATEKTEETPSEPTEALTEEQIKEDSKMTPIEGASDMQEVSNEPAEELTPEQIKEDTEMAPVEDPDEKLEEAKKVLNSTDPNDPARWYIVHTYSGHENKVAKSIKQRVQSLGFENRIFDIIVPTRNTIKVSQGKKETVKEKIFPGYVLVKMTLDDESWLLIRTTQGVTAFIGAGNKPTPISEKEVEAIQKFMNEDEPLYKTSFTIGEAVKIVDGPFSDFLGTIDDIDEAKGKLKVLVSIFGRETPVELDFLQVNKL